jgi:hypothetical protein
METVMAVAAKRDRTPFRRERRGDGLDSPTAGRGPERVLGPSDSDVDPCCAPQILWVTQLLGRASVGPQGEHLGHVRDVVSYQIPDPATTFVTGLVVDFGGHRAFVPAGAVHHWGPPRLTIEVLSAYPAFLRRPGELLLGEDALGRVVETATAPGTNRIRDVVLRRAECGWVVGGVDLRTTAQAVLGSPRRIVDWDDLVERRWSRHRKSEGRSDALADPDRRA